MTAPTWTREPPERQELYEAALETWRAYQGYTGAEPSASALDRAIGNLYDAIATVKP
jgi:hypothetical protein